MKLETFTISIAVKDIHKTKKNYKTLGFSDLGGGIN